MGAQWKQKWRELAADQKGKIVGKLVREIQIATKLGGPNPDLNARLSAALVNARKQSVSKDTIERAIAKGSGTGTDAVTYDTVLFEGFAPHQVPVIVECLTENNNRTSSEVKVIFRDASANLGGKGSVAWMFDHVGMIEATHTTKIEDLDIAALEAEADDVEPMDVEDGDEAKSAARFFCQASSLGAVTAALKSAGWTVTTSELSYRAKSYPELSDAQREEVTNFLQELDGHDDVHRVHAAVR
jgi:YebC/PmpR family DNA-binding regulatory protein